MKIIFFLGFLVITQLFFSQNDSVFTNLDLAFKTPLKVNSLNLKKQKLQTLPDSINKFINLRKIDLSDNEIKEIPSSFWDLKKLVYLNLHQNNLSSVSDSIVELENLWFLDISNNKLKNLPNTIVQLKKLDILNFMDNDFLLNQKEIKELKQQLPKRCLVHHGKSIIDTHISH